MKKRRERESENGRRIPTKDSLIFFFQMEIKKTVATMTTLGEYHKKKKKKR